MGFFQAQGIIYLPIGLYLYTFVTNTPLQSHLFWNLKISFLRFFVSKGFVSQGFLYHLIIFDLILIDPVVYFQVIFCSGLPRDLCLITTLEIIWLFSHLNSRLFIIKVIIFFNPFFILLIILHHSINLQDFI